MKQVTKRKTISKENKKTVTNHVKKSTHPKYGTSKLEEKFAKEFLDKLGLEYIYQFEAKDIGRSYDFFCNGVLIEIDGGYWHGDPRLYEASDLNRIQKKSQRVDEYKNNWALSHGYPIIRFWEKDINENPSGVMKKLEEVFYLKTGEKKKIYRKDIKTTPRKTNNNKTKKNY